MPFSFVKCQKNTYHISYDFPTKLYLHHTVMINESSITTKYLLSFVHDCTHVYCRTRTFLHFCKTASILRTWKLKICLSSSFPFLFQDFNPNCFSSYYYEVFFCTTKSNVGCAMQFQCLKIQNVLHYLLLLL